MTQLQDKAIARSADHENLVGELVEALKYYADAVRPDNTCGGGYYDFVDDGKVAREAIAKAKAEAQQ